MMTYHVPTHVPTRSLTPFVFLLLVLITTETALSSAKTNGTSGAAVVNESSVNNDLNQYETAFLTAHCGGRESCLEQLAISPIENDILTFAEQFVIQKYTESNNVLDERIFETAIKKLPTSKETLYRGGSRCVQSPRDPTVRICKFEKKGQITTVNRFTSTSSKQITAENFVKDQLLIFHAESARSIAKYSVTGEDEFILSPGQEFKIEEIRFETINLSYGEGDEASAGKRRVRIVEMREL